MATLHEKLILNLQNEKAHFYDPLAQASEVLSPEVIRSPSVQEVEEGLWQDLENAASATPRHQAGKLRRKL